MVISSKRYSETRVSHYSTRQGFPAVGDPAVLYYDEDRCELWGWKGTTYIKISGASGWQPAPDTSNPLDALGIRALYNQTGGLTGYAWEGLNLSNIANI